VTVQRQVLVRPRSTGSGSRRVYVRNTTKGNRTRRVRIDPETAAALRRWKAAQAEARLAFGPAYRDDGGLGEVAPWVVTEPDGYVIHPDTLLRRWVALVAAGGVTPITLHGARHSFAEIALASGVRIDVVSRALGHASISTTADIYSHDNDQAASEAAAMVAAALEATP
jgi:integrase